MSKIDDLSSLIEEGKHLEPLGGALFEGGYNKEHQPEYFAWRLQTITLIESLGDFARPLLKEIESDSYGPYFLKSSVSHILGILKTAIILAKNHNKLVKEDKKLAAQTEQSVEKVFLVHGRNKALWQETARFLDKVDIEPIILFEQPGRGQTIIEKLESNSAVSFAVVLLTPDDMGKLAGDEGELKPRARQNVILELGYFVGRLGRSNVAVLYDESVELPSDYRGVEYIKIDAEGAWRLKLSKEMKHAGLKIDMNKVI